MAQNQTHSPTELPDAPGLQEMSSQKGTASVAGTVSDSTGALVPGARVVLVSGGVEGPVVDAGSGGEFGFTDLAAGSYHVKVSSPGMGDASSPEFVLADGQSLHLDSITLAVAKNRADILVTASQQEIATEQVNAQLEQRVLGIVPDFYVSYAGNPAPMSTKQKYYLALRATTDPVTFLTAGFSAGIGQAADLYGGYGQGAEGYAKRYGAAFADDLIDVFLADAVFPSLFHQDPRYVYKGTGTKKERAKYAIMSTFITRSDSGKREFNYSHILGDFASAGISNAYYPPGDRGFGLTMRNGGVAVGGTMVVNLMREFILKGLTPKAPKDPTPAAATAP